MGRPLQRLLKTRFDAKRYWQRRFLRDDTGWSAVGDRDLTAEQNQRSNLEVMACITGVLQQCAAPLAGKTLLDAGCGYGNFTDAAQRLGCDAVGVDFCELAIQEARRRYPRSRFEVGDVVHLDLSRRFDIILSVNVLVAVTDHDAWAQALAGLEAHLSEAGVVVIFETLATSEEGGTCAEHVRFRTLEQYRRRFEDLDLIIQHHERALLHAEGHCKHIVVAGRR